MAPRPKKIVDSSSLIVEEPKKIVDSRSSMVEEVKELKTVKAKVAEIASVQIAETRNDESKAEALKAPERFVVPPSANPQPVRPTQNNMRPAFQPRYNNFNNGQRFSRPIIASEPIVTEEITGIFDQTGTDGRGIVRSSFRPGETDAVLQSMQARQAKLRPGDMVTGLARKPKENEPYWTMMQIT